ncbi:MAG: ATP-dependent Clp protease ATP-binding subunit ClpX [Planctomycetes bacterium]|nr:ATP-dependent Clp protease ATP-binding subunit ClpX [Planctomycetota bacterium]
MSKGRRTYTERCTFCGKSRHMVDSLVAGPPDVYICNECVELCNTILLEETRKGGTARREPGVSFRLRTPREIHSFLNEYVIGQERAKRTLAVAVYNHYRRISVGFKTDEVELEKSNILLVGPTGSGKTLLARSLARFLDVPFAISDATTLTEAGYVGEDVENVLLRLLQAADFDRERAERGIVYIDEIDKIAKTQNNQSITRDVSGEGVQQGLLKILEGTISNIPPQGGRKHPEQQYLQIDTTNILFICGGTFSGIEELIKKRVGKKRIGFVDDDGKEQGQDSAARYLPLIETEDLLAFGMIPEFIGRLPAVTVLDPLGEGEILRVMVEPRNAIIRQYQKFFEIEGVELAFDEDALRAIAKDALKRETGVRAVRALVEDFLRDLLYDLPENKDKVARYIVTAAAYRGEEPVGKVLRADVKRPPQRDSP